MPTTQLPENPSLEHLKGQAKLIRDLIRSGDPGGLSMVDEFHPRLDADALEEDLRTSFKTTDAQLIIARMYRFDSWPKLRDHIAIVNSHSFTPGLERTEPASFVEAACLDYAEDGPSPADRLAEAHRMLEADPTVATGSIEAVATVGDHHSLTRYLETDAAAVNRPCGPNQWPPLLYAVYSRISTDSPEWSALETVRLLLDRGADANAGFLWRGLVPPFTALTGAFGGGESHQPWQSDRLTIARMLLDAGADPNDGQLLYNNGIGGQNHDDPAHLQLLVEYGLGTQQNGPWYQRLGDQLRDPGELVYDELEAAAKRNRPKILRYLLTLGLDLNRPIGRSQQTPARIAATEGHDSILAELAQAGIGTQLTPAETALSHTRTNNTDALNDLLAQHTTLLEDLRHDYPASCNNVSAQHAQMLERLIDLGFDINDRSTTKTPLHHAAEAGDIERARLFINHGADPNLLDTHIGATPWGWANHFGHTDTADYLHPLTHHGDPLPEITIKTSQNTQTLATPSHLENLLRRLHDTRRPLLATLQHQGNALTVGVGHPDISVALYLDDRGVPWHAKTDKPVGTIPRIEWTARNGPTRFSEHAYITLDQAVDLATDFVNDPTIRPRSTSSTWEREGHS